MRECRVGGLFVVSLSLMACSAGADRLPLEAPEVSQDSTSAPAPAEDREGKLRELILGIGGPEVPEAQPVIASADGNAIENHDSQLFACTYDRHKGVELFDSLVSFDPNADALWPGAVVQTKSLAQGILEPIGLPRRPGTITFGSALGDTAGGSLSKQLGSPSQATAQDAINHVLKESTLHFPTKVNYRAEEAHSLTEAAAKAGLAVQWLQGSVRASFEGTWTDAKTTMIVNFTQSYYSVSFSPPASPEAVFDPSTRVEDAALYMGPGNAPAYVASVTYGRMLLVKIESSASASELKAALDVAFNAGVASGSVDAGFDHKKILRDANVSVFALGGDPALATEVMTNSEHRAEKIAAYLENGAAFSATTPGVPVSYTVRQLANNQLVRVASTLDYRVPSCAAERSRFAVSLRSLHVADNGQSWGNPDLDVKVFARTSSTESTACTAENPVACGDLLFEQKFSSVRDNEVRDFTQSQEHRLDALSKDGERVELVFAVKSGNKAFLAIDRHHFSVSGNQGIWSGLGSRSFGSSTEGLTVNLNYDIDRLQP